MMSFGWSGSRTQMPELNCLQKNWSSLYLPWPFCILFHGGRGHGGLPLCYTLPGKPATWNFITFCSANQLRWGTNLGSCGIKSHHSSWEVGICTPVHLTSEPLLPWAGWTSRPSPFLHILQWYYFLHSLPAFVSYFNSMPRRFTLGFFQFCLADISQGIYSLPLNVENNLVKN